MFYGGYNQGYAGEQGYVGDQVYADDQGYAGGQGYGYQQQPVMPPYAADGYNPYGQQDVYAQQQQQMMMMGGAGGGNAGAMDGGGYQGGYPDQGQYVQGYVEPSADAGDRGASTLKSKKSFSGPPPGAERKQSVGNLRSARSTRSTRSSKAGDSSGMARHGSVFVSNRERDTQVSISTRGGMSMHCLGDDADDLKDYYGDMAGRNEVRKMDGLRAVKSYRGDIEDGEDVGKPRRVTNRRNVDGRSATGYGGINFKRHAAMRNGEQWGDVEVRMRDGTRKREIDDDFPQPQQQPQPQMQMQPQMPMYQPPMVVPPMEEGPVMPQIYSQEEIHSYSNLSDAFAENEEMEEEETDF